MKTYSNLVFDLRIWRYHPNERDNFTHLLFHLIAKADPCNKAKLRQVYPLECQVYDDWQNSPNEDNFFAQ